MSSVGKKNKSGPGSRLRFRLDSRIYDPPFAKTRLTAQTLRSAAEISANLAAKASPSLTGLAIFLFHSIINLPHAVFCFPSRFTLYQIKTARNSRFHQVKTAR